MKRNLSSKFRSLLLLAAIPGCFVATPDDDADAADTDDMEDTESDPSDAPDRESASNPVSATGADASDEGGSDDEGGDASMTGPITSVGDDTGGSDDEGGDASMTGPITSAGEDDSGGPDDDGEELLTNGSFEDWSGGMPDAWVNGDAVLEEVVGDAADGERSVRVSSAIYNSVGQYVSTPLDAGSCLELAVSVRSESGSTQAPMVLLQGTDEGGTDVQIFVELDWSTDGQWRTTASSVVTAEAWTTFSFNVLSTDSVPQVFVVDDASVRLVPCA